MTYSLSPRGVRTALLGVQVNRATAVLPQTATGAIFTVAGGRVVITSLVGEVTTALGATVTTLAVNLVPTVGATTAVATATAVTSSAVGDWFTLNATFGGALVHTAVAGGVALPPTGGIFTAAGSVSITTSANDTGSVKWSLTYIPYDDAATVVAA